MLTIERLENRSVIYCLNSIKFTFYWLPAAGRSGGPADGRAAAAERLDLGVAQPVVHQNLSRGGRGGVACGATCQVRAMGGDGV